MPCNDCACTCMSAAVEAQVADFAASPIAAIEKPISLEMSIYQAFFRLRKLF